MTNLLRLKGFLPFILVVFLNAFVDLGHKIIIQNTVFKVYDGQTQILLTAVVNALILLPFIFLFSPAGFLSDRFQKPKVIRVSAAVAVGLTLMITGSYYLGWFEVAFAMTFLLAVQSAFYSPAKYGYIKELVGTERLASANSVVQAVTIVAILLGVFAFSILFEEFLGSAETQDVSSIISLIAPVGWALVLLSLLELISAMRLPEGEALTSFETCKSSQQVSPANTAEEHISAAINGQKQSATNTKRQTTAEKFSWNDYFSGQYLQRNLTALWNNQTIWLSIVGLSVFWGISQVILAAFPAHAKMNLGIENTVIIQGLLACSGIGIVLGSILAGRASRQHIETGLIPLGAIGVVISVLLIPQMQSTSTIALSFILLGLSGGLFIVPLNSLIQFHAPDKQLGTVLAGNNWIQNLVMLAFLGLALVFAYFGVNSLGLFYLLTITAIIGAIYTISRLPQSLVRLVVSFIFAGRYRVEVLGFKNLPSQGAVLMLGNHISWLDWAMIQIACPRPVKFVMDRNIYSRWYLKWLMDLFGVVPIARGNSKSSLETINQLLKDGEVVCLFPEGAISRNGQLGEFKRGYERCVTDADGNPVEGVILPFYLRGLWGSRFSRSNEHLQELRSEGLRRDIIVAFGKPIPIVTQTAELKRNVFDLSMAAWQQHTQGLESLPAAWINTVKSRGSKLCITDVRDGLSLNGYKTLTAAITFSKEISRTSPNKGARIEKNVGLLLPTSSAGVIANMAALLAGKTLVNLNYTASIPALVSATKKAEIRTLYTSKKFLKKLQQRGLDFSELTASLNVIYLEDLAAQISPLRKAVTLFAVRILPASVLRRLFVTRTSYLQPAAILFSSGSEGEPKGVMLSHQNIMGNIKQVSDVLDTQQDDRVMATLPLFHAFGLTVTGFMPLIEGIPAVCHPDPTDVLNIAKGVAKHKATIFCGTSTFLRLFNRNNKVHPLMLDSLRIVVAGAEKLNSEVRDAFQLKFNKPIYEGYGTTETTPVASVNIPDRMDNSDWHVQKGSKRGTVGLPLPGSSFRIVDPETLETLPCGEDGLILIGGTQVMLGYLNDLDKTDEVVLQLDGQRWYSSGDKGHLDEDGFLTIVDRYSRFAKIGGEMISLGAIETAISSNLNEEIEILATTIPDDKKGEKVVLLFNNSISEETLKDHIQQTELNPLMRPSSFVAVDEIPKLGSGKSDFRQARLVALERLGS